MIRWRLNEQMAKHRVNGKELAKLLNISENAMSSLRTAEAMPRLDGVKLERICQGITKLSKIHRVVTPHDLIEYLPDETILAEMESLVSAEA